MIERNTNGLKTHAQKKRQESFEKLEQGIQKLLREEQKINFNAVAKASGLSKGWLYKEPEVKNRIEKLREQYGNKKVVKQKPSDASKDALIKTIKARSQKLVAENKDLKRQLEIVYGKLLKGKELEQKARRLEAENQRLKDRLYNPIEQNHSIPDNSKDINPRIIQEFESLDLTLSSTLAKQIKKTDEGVVITAIESLKQQIDSTLIRSPEAWLSAAIRDNWKPNEAIGENSNKDSFSKWYELARAYGVVTQCRQEDDKWLVKENTGKWLAYEEFCQKWSLEYLRSVINP